MHLYFKKKLEEISSPNKTVYFSMGCFWRPEELFWKQNGVLFTEVGYAECSTEKPSCEDAFKENITHKEVVKVIYNPDILSFEGLLGLFFNNHTSDLRSDFPVPNLYRSRVYIENLNDITKYNIYIKKMMINRSNKGNHYPLSTEIKEIKNYIKAEDSHQQYNLKNKK